MPLTHFGRIIKIMRPKSDLLKEERINKLRKMKGATD